MFDIIGPIIVSIITAVVIAWFKEKKTNTYNFLKYSNDDIRIINSFIGLSVITMLLGIYIVVTLTINELQSSEIHNLFFYRNIFSTLILNALNLSFHFEFLKKCLEKNKKFLIMLIFFTLYLWYCIYRIYQLLNYFETKDMYNTIDTILVYYFMIIVYRENLNLQYMRPLKKILIITNDNCKIEGTDFYINDNYVMFYDYKARTKKILFNSEIKLIEFVYKNNSIE